MILLELLISLFQILKTVSLLLGVAADNDAWELLVVSGRVWFEYLESWLQGGAILLVVLIVLLMVLYLAKTLQKGHVHVSVVFLFSGF